MNRYNHSKTYRSPVGGTKEHCRLLIELNPSAQIQKLDRKRHILLAYKLVISLIGLRVPTGERQRGGLFEPSMQIGFAFAQVRQRQWLPYVLPSGIRLNKCTYHRNTGIIKKLSHFPLGISIRSGMANSGRIILRCSAPKPFEIGWRSLLQLLAHGKSHQIVQHPTAFRLTDKRQRDQMTEYFVINFLVHDNL
ncbi:hypothetical protein D3C73_821880 [compost metagenome]